MDLVESVVSENPNLRRKSISRKYYTKRKSFLSNFSLTTKIILINVILFIVSWIFLAFGNESFFLKYFTLIPKEFFSGKVWTILTSMFLHLALFHLFANMISLFFLGNLSEKILGKKRFLIFYLASGIFAGLFYIALSYLFGSTELGARIVGGYSIPAIGASGAIFGLVGVLAVLIPKNRIYLIVGPLIAIISIPILAGIFQLFSINPGLLNVLDLVVNVYIMLSIFFMLSFNPRLRKIALPLEMPFWVLPIVAIVPLTIVSFFVDLPIGNSAHLGGLIVGLGYGYYLKKKFPRKTRMLARMFS